MGRRYETVSFLSDYGLEDEFVGIVHSVLRSIAPHAAIIDVTPGVPAFDVRAGGLALARSAQYLCNGVVLAIVDPGVATDRRAVAVEVDLAAAPCAPHAHPAHTLCAPYARRARAHKWR